MSAKSAISKEIFAPLDERMLGAVQVKRRTKKKIPFLATGGQGEYLTYICLSGNSILHSAADSVTSAVQKASQALNERGERLGRAEEKTEDLKNSAQQFAETAHKLAMKHKC
ncbi:syntaxin-binding protein 6 isoform 5 [Homo sapiens]|uniref:syntaxin-binding protein 6 isoform 5 n=1 Tax=Homo sapiens TaxID=9606 RepID=UPI001B3827DD|nr:syntaxin-binding protein 6 isoform 5 [Homo sapiens]XP_055147602.1 syntaxin-binding protein 6 isoform X3 [Symphalangus syndactylus]